MKLSEQYRVSCHTDTVGPGSTFVAIKGAQHDGTKFIVKALEKDATRIVVHDSTQLDDATIAAISDHNAELVRVTDTRKALAELSAQAYDYPAHKLHLLGVTGTKGKTSSAFLLEHILHAAGYKVALLSTVCNRIDGQQFESTLTTPQPDYLHMFFNACVQAGVTHVVMEVAAQALSLHRVAGLAFAGIIFTNFSHEHGEFYANHDDYFAAKCLLFDQCAEGAPVIINADDPKGQFLLGNNTMFVGYTLNNERVPYHYTVLGSVATGVELAGSLQNGSLVHLRCPSLLGMFNAYNVAGVVTLCDRLGIDRDALLRGCATFSGTPGRLEEYTLRNGARCFIDYAHNPDSYEKVLSLLRSMTDNLIVVFGAGGQRDVAKRPIMGLIAHTHADCVILTADNPRTEEIETIMDDICAQLDTHTTKVHRIHDRAQAITFACSKAQPDSIVVVLGKGTDEYQIIGQTKHFFSDRQVVQQYQNGTENG